MSERLIAVLAAIAKRRRNLVQPVGPGEELDRMPGMLGRLLGIEALHALHDMLPGQGALRGDEGLARRDRLACDRAPHFQRGLEVAFEDAPGAAMAGAALDHREI